MTHKTLWAAESVGNLLTTELNNLADATMMVDAADYDNAANLHMFASFFFHGIFDADCDAGALVELHIFYKLDDTHYGDGEEGDVGAANGSGNSLHGVFHIGAEALPLVFTNRY